MKNSSFIKSIFFGNYFYGFCAVALSIEATIQQKAPLNPLGYFVFIFLATVIFYTKPYLSLASIDIVNHRISWYKQNHLLVRLSNVLYTFICASLLLIFTIKNWEGLFKVELVEWLLALLFPFIAGLYYGGRGRFSLRSIGWLKPFVIGFVWAGIVTIYPLIYYCTTHNVSFEWNEIGNWLFLKNLMFVAVLCIMFDIKDYVIDNKRSLKTFVVETGLRTTIFYIIVPLILAGLASFWIFAFAYQFSIVKIFLNSVPFILMLVLAYLLRRRKSLLFYLTMIDGVMLVKACCGIIAMAYF